MATRMGETFAFYLDVALIGLYVISIGVAWLVGLRGKEAINTEAAKTLRLVVGATIVDQIRRRV